MGLNAEIGHMRKYNAEADEPVETYSFDGNYPIHDWFARKVGAEFNTYNIIKYDIVLDLCRDIHTVLFEVQRANELIPDSDGIYDDRYYDRLELFADNFSWILDSLERYENDGQELYYYADR